MLFLFYPKNAWIPINYPPYHHLPNIQIVAIHNSRMNYFSIKWGTFHLLSGDWTSDQFFWPAVLLRQPLSWFPDFTFILLCLAACYSLVLNRPLSSKVPFQYPIYLFILFIYLLFYLFVYFDLFIFIFLFFLFYPSSRWIEESTSGYQIIFRCPLETRIPVV